MTKKERIREKKRQKCRRKYLKSPMYSPYVQSVFMWNLTRMMMDAMKDPEFVEGYMKWLKETGREK